MKKIILSMLLVTCLVSCQDDDANAIINTEPVAIQFEELQKDRFAANRITNEVRGNYVINTPQQLTSFYDFYQSGNVSASIDFNQSTVISIVSDKLPGYGETDAFEVQSIIQQNDTVTVNIHSHYAMDEVKLLMEYQPYQVVKIPKTTLPVVFLYD
jgi:hypothetical protein